jgi:hypothetical protein
MTKCLHCRIMNFIASETEGVETTYEEVIVALAAVLGEVVASSAEDHDAMIALATTLAMERIALCEKFGFTAEASGHARH